MKRALLLLFPLLACQSGLAQDRVDGANISLNALKEIRTALGNFYPVDPENPIRHLPSESRGELSLYYKFPESKTVVEIPNFRSKHHEVSRRREGNASITRYRIEWIPMANRKRSLPTSRLTVKVGVGAPRNLRPEEYRGETRSRDDAEREYQQAFAEGCRSGRVYQFTVSPASWFQQVRGELPGSRSTCDSSTGKINHRDWDWGRMASKLISYTELREFRVHGLPAKAIVRRVRGVQCGDIESTYGSAGICEPWSGEGVSAMTAWIDHEHPDFQGPFGSKLRLQAVVRGTNPNVALGKNRDSLNYDARLPTVVA